ncbi:MAG: FHA domain-containing protein [Silicimonas sp.]|nr:FHA domain-containing protein [Silicimonas sp.]
MLTKKDAPENPGAADMDMEADAPLPMADDSGEINMGEAEHEAQADLPPAADPSHPVMPREEEPEVVGSGWGDAAWSDDDWDDEDWDDDEDWGAEDSDPAPAPISADRKALVSEIRDAMVSVNAIRPTSEPPVAAPAPQESRAETGPDFSEDEEFGRKAKARSELRNNGEEDRILEKTDQVMDEEASSRRRSAMAHLKAAAAATKADRVLRHVVSRDPSGDPEEQSPYRDDLAKVVRPHSTSRPISRVVARSDTRSPIWDQGEGDEDAALYAAAEEGSGADVNDRVDAELAAEEDQRIARGPMDLSEEDFADDSPAPSARVESAFPSSPFARDIPPSAPVNAFEDIGEEDFEEDLEADDGFEAEDDSDKFAVDFDDEDDFGPRPSRVVSAAVAFANAPEPEVDETPPETEVRKKIWEAAEEVAAEVEQEDEAVEEPVADMGADAEEPLDIASELAAAKAVASSAQSVAATVSPTMPSMPSIPAAHSAPLRASAEGPRVAPVRPHTGAPDAAAPAEGQSIADVSANVPGRAGRSAGRVKTRLLGFQANEERDVFEEARGAASAQAAMFPAGWIVVIEGPGRGASFTLQTGVSQIGRGEDQTVRLDFGDTAISRNNHAAVAYDDEQGKFFLGHGGKSNLVRLNGMPVLSTEEMTSGDEIRIGETTLKFMALCGDGFTWGATGETTAE